jgi:mannose-6-phosphate isomerase-like protein (cupin superfamily)
MNAYELNELAREQQDSGKAYLEFLRAPTLSMGLYHLPAGSLDPQSPHTEDEVYYVVSGRAQIQVNGEDRPVQAGSVVFVAAHAPHKFHTIEQDLQVLVFFAPAEYSLNK